MADSVRASGPVTIGPAVFVVEEMSVEGELGLLAGLRAGAKRALGPLSFYANAIPVAAALRKIDQGGEAAALMETTARLVATGAALSDAAAWEYRQTPDGLADEIYARTRRTQPDATRAEIRAVINDANAPEVAAQLTDALSKKA